MLPAQFVLPDGDILDLYEGQTFLCVPMHVKGMFEMQVTELRGQTLRLKDDEGTIWFADLSWLDDLDDAVILQVSRD